jgi:hypothetical protein
MPIGATCSAVLSAACHGPSDDNTALQSLRWGVIELASHLRRRHFSNQKPEEELIKDIVLPSKDQILNHLRENIIQQSSNKRMIENESLQSEHGRAAETAGMCCFTTSTSVWLPQLGERYI